METQREKDRKRYDELLSQGMRPSEALQKIAIESRGQTEEIEGSRYQYSKHPVNSEYTLMGELKHLGHEVGREVTEFPKRKLKEAAEDIETGRAYRESYRKHKIEAASPRGAETEQRHYRNKIGREARKIKLEEERERISLAAEKAARIERAKIITRQRYSQLAHPQIYGLSSRQPVVVQPRRHRLAPVYPRNSYRQLPAEELDPMGIYTLRPQQQQQASTKVDMSYMHSLLGFNPQQKSQIQTTPNSVDTNFAQKMLGFNPQQQSQQDKPNGQSSKPKRRKLNYFTGQYEWV
jgi:hypothetical protein